jgi:[ribosomal protein S5]-alanine N-acetyltransferase
VIETERLRLFPHSPQQLLALVDEPARYEQLSGFPAANGFREFFVSEEVSTDWLASLRDMRAADPWCLGFAAVDPLSGTVIGTGGFKGPADANGVVEIAYGIAPDYQSRGYATEVARALVAYAMESSSVKVVRAHTLPSANASTKVLTKCGFQFVGEVIDPDDGLVWRWELARQSVPGPVRDS